MGREIRRVPLGWEHPKTETGRFVPLLDEDFETASREWKEGFLAWERGDHEGRAKYPEMEFWEWDGGPPDRERHRPRWSDEERVGYQVYETVSEGTPVSPVFATPEEVVAWAMAQGHSEHAAREFVRVGRVMSAVYIPGRGLASGIDALDLVGIEE